MRLPNGEQESSSSPFPCRCEMCRDHFNGENLSFPCTNLKVAGKKRVHVSGHRQTFSLEQSKSIKGKEKAKRQKRDREKAIEFSRRFAPAMENPNLAANPVAAATAREIAIALTPGVAVAGDAASSSSSSSFSTSLPVASGAGERAFALSYARIDAAMFQQRDAEFNVAVSVPWQSDLEASSDDDDEDGDCEMGDDSI